MRKRFLGPLGLVAGFVDATGGGGWGPVGTPAILASGRMEPRKVIGSIDTSEFLVALAASLGFLVALGSQGVDVTWALGLLVGGLIAAPIAAWLVRHVPPRLLGSLVGGMIVLTNTRTLLTSDWIDAGDAPATPSTRSSTPSGPPRSSTPTARTARTGRSSPPRRSPRRPSCWRTWRPTSSRAPGTSSPTPGSPPAGRAHRATETGSVPHASGSSAHGRPRARTHADQRR